MLKNFEKGTIYLPASGKKAEDLPWVEHKAFKGVFLKHLIKGEDTGGALSCHLVRINSGCCIDHHTHEGKLEVHEVIEGSGNCQVNDEFIPYMPGSVALIPADIDHKVVAGKEGIFLLAKFSPALL